MTWRVAVDIGGTFTDVVAYDDRALAMRVGKTLSTPADLVAGVGAGLDQAGIGSAHIGLLIHGSTVVFNALIERTGADTALVTTAGFRDVYEIGRINRPDAFNLAFRKHRPLIPRHRVYEVSERLDASGHVRVPLDEHGALLVARQLRDAGVQAVAIALLHAYRRPDHENRLAEIIRQECPGAFVCTSSEVSREYREYERTSTVVANAYVGPIIGGYLGRLEDRIGSRGPSGAGTLAIMQSNGGLCDAATASRQPIQLVESGPAGGVAGTIELCRQLGYQRAIAFDMGGTTAKASVIRNLAFPLASDYFVGGYTGGLPIRVPVLDIVEVGTGGGSIAWLDAAGGVHVGPRSAGAQPGPACYGRGGNQATITDASVVLGYLSSAGRLSGGLEIDGAAARLVIARLADALKMPPERAATGILAIAAASMANAVRAVTTERGLDPRDFVLFAYGGNGPLHVSLVARELGISRVVIPPLAAVFSALGMLMADLRTDVVSTDITPLASVSAGQLEARFRALEQTCAARLPAGGIGAREIEFLRSADMRYLGQEHTVTVPAAEPGTAARDPVAALKERFDLEHLERFGHHAPGEPAELVSLRASAVGTLSRPRLPEIRSGPPQPAPEARSGGRVLVFPDAGMVEASIYQRPALLAGNVVGGPAVIEEGTSSTLLRPGDTAEVDRLGNLIVTIGARK